MQFDRKRFGLLAFLAQRELVELGVHKSAAGYYIGTRTPEGEPNTRESARYWPKRSDALHALQTGDWLQKWSL